MAGKQTGGIKIVFEDGDKLGRKLETKAKKFSEKQIKAIQSVGRRVKDEIEYEGRNNIRAGGDFSSQRWVMGFVAKLSFENRQNLRIRITHSVSYWKVFEFGARILGKPLLWIPFDFGNAFGVRARDYPGKLFRVDRAGKAPLLIDPANGPQYFGKESVTIPKKWNLREIVLRISRKMNSYYKDAMRDG